MTRVFASSRACSRRCAAPAVFALVLLEALSAVVAGGLTWEKMSRSTAVPAHSVKGGYQRVDKYDNPHYLGRFGHKDGVIPATVTKYQPHYEAYTAWEDHPLSTDQFEIAVANENKVRWVPAKDGDVPVGASAAGYAPDGEVLFACRVFNSDRKVGNHVYMMTIGVLQPSTGLCITEFHGVHKDTAYEVLVVDA